jgi:hypothetical protein
MLVVVPYRVKPYGNAICIHAELAPTSALTGSWDCLPACGEAPATPHTRTHAPATRNTAHTADAHSAHTRTQN